MACVIMSALSWQRQLPVHAQFGRAQGRALPALGKMSGPWYGLFVGVFHKHWAGCLRQA